MTLVDRRHSFQAVLSVLAVPLVLAAVFVGVTLARAADQPVTIQNFAFAPATLNVAVGDKITWTNKDATAHTISSDTAGVFDSGSTAPGATFSFTAATAGTITYHCNIHATMKATIVVSAAGSASPTAGAPKTGNSAESSSNDASLWWIGGILGALALGSAGVVARATRRR